jgi:pimeloyl-ACP methyl ester carboxylesterase
VNNLLQCVNSPSGTAVKKFLGIGLFLYLVFTNFIPVEAQQPEPRDAFTTTSCADFQLPAAWETSPRVQCGFLSVPEDHNAPGGNQIQLGVVILKSPSTTPLADPVFIAQGGPGGSTIDTYTKLIRLDTPLGANRDIVLWDQRGTLFSTPNLLCSEFLDETIPTLDQILTPDENERLALQAAQACRDRLDGQGINLSAYDSLQNAADIEALRQALGYEKINYYGVSYGTLLGLHFARLFPDSLRSLVLDAVVPPQTNFLLNAGQSMTRSFNELFQACEADPECSAAYPNLEQVFFDVLDELDREPASVQVFDGETGIVYDTLINGDLFQSTIFQLLYPTEIIPFLPKIIADASERNFDFLANAILPLIIFDRTISEGMYFSVICAEDADYDMSDINTSGLPDRIGEAEGRDLATFLKLCQTWDVAPLSAEEDSPVSSPVPTLLLSGRFDPITPPAYASQVKETLPNSFDLVFPNGGHGQAFGGDCQDQILLSFLNDPDQTPDASCVDSEISFVTPRDFLLFPPLATLFKQDFGALFQNLFWGGTILLVILLQLSALPVFLIIFFVERQQKRRLTGSDLPAATAAGAKRDSIWVRISPIWPLLFAFLAIFFACRVGGDCCRVDCHQ